MKNTTHVLLALLMVAVALPAWAQVPGNNRIKDLKVNKEAIQTASPSNPQALAKKAERQAQIIEVQKYAKTITSEDLKAHLEFIASDELEGRETAQRGQKLAALYLSTQFRLMGLSPGNGDSYYQEYELTRAKINEVKMIFDGKTEEKFGKGFVFMDKMAFAKDLKADLVFAGFGIESDGYNNLEGLDLKGKAAVILAGEPMQDGKSIIKGSGEDSPTFDFRTKRGLLQDAGASAVLMVIPDDDFKRFAGSPWMRHNMESPSLSLTHLQKDNIPLAFIPVSMADQMMKKSKKGAEEWQEVLNKDAKVPSVNFGKYGMEIKSDAEVEVVKAENVLGFIEGTDKKDEVVVLTAHYDHLGVRDDKVFNGADDDGTGTVALLEIAEAFMKAVEDGKRPRRSILIMPVSGEEKGLLGSRYYTDHPVYDLSNTVCNLNVDMIGRIDKNHDDGNYIYIIGSDMLSTDLHKANERANKEVVGVNLDYRYNTEDDPNRFYYRSDHYNFAKNNIPCIFYFSGVHEDYHKSTDTVEKIDYQKSTKITRLIFATAWEVANMDKRLVVDKAGK